MDYTLEVTQQKELLLRTVRKLQSKSEGTLQRVAPLLSFQRGMGMVTKSSVHQLRESTSKLCHELDDLENQLRFCQNHAVARLDGGVSAPLGLHVSADGTLYLASSEVPKVAVLTRAGRPLQALPCVTDGGRQRFLPEDVTLTRAGMVAVTDLAGGDVKIFNPHSRFGRGEWLSLGEFRSPRGVAVDTVGRLLVADYEPGKVHVFDVDHCFRLLNVRSIKGLRGPRYVCPGPGGGTVVSEECGDVKLYGAGHKLLCSFSATYGHRFGSPAGVCSDVEGNVLVADEQKRCVVLFPPNGSPVPLVTEGLCTPAGLACCSRGQLYVGDTGDNSVKVFRYRNAAHHGKGTGRLAADNDG
ncbi:NHLC4 protein, partial [Polypterus senegalus]